MSMSFSLFPCISPEPPETRWGQILDLQSIVAVVQVERPFGGVREEGVAILTRLNRLLTQAPIEKEVLRSLLHTFGGVDISNLIILSFSENECTVGMRGDGRIYMRRGKTFAPLLRREGVLTGAVKPNDILMLLSKEAAVVLDGEERDLFSQNLTPKEIAEALTIRFSQAGKKAEGAVGCILAFDSNAQVFSADTPKMKSRQASLQTRVKSLVEFLKNKLKEKKSRAYLLVGVLTGLFLISVLLGIRHQQADTSYHQMVQATEQAKKLFDEGISLIETQPLKSRDALKQANDLLSPYAGEHLPKGKEGKAIESLIKQVQDNLQLVQKVYSKEPQLFYDASFLQKERHINIFSVGQENLSLVDTDNGMLAVVSLQSKDAEILAGGGGI